MTRKKQSRDSRNEVWCELGSDLKLAQRLVRYGRKENDAEAIELAARILRESISAIHGQRPDFDSAESAQMDQDFSEGNESPEMVPRGPVPGTGDGLIARGATPTGVSKVGAGKWEATISKRETLTLQPHPTFAKKTKARVTVTSQDNAKLFVYWRRVDLVSDPDDFAVGQGNVTAKWRTGITKKAWEIQIENRSGPDNLKISIDANSTG